MRTAELEALYREHFQRVYSYVYYRVLDAPVAEDVTSDVFVKAVTHYDAFDPSKASFSTWIMRIAHNTLVDHYRTRKTHGDIAELPPEQLCCEDSYPALDDTQAEVARLLAYLSPEDRELVFLKFHEGMKNVQIAESLGMNPATVATRVRRALQTMRAHADGSRR